MPITVQKFRLALTKVAAELPPKYVQILQRHYNAPHRTTTAGELAEGVGYANFRSINLHYGLLAARLAAAIGCDVSGDEKLSLLCSFTKPNSEANAEWLLVMRAELAEALEQIGWVRPPEARETLRITTWNCNRGRIESKLPQLLGINPDVAAIQECQRPTRVRGEPLNWIGDREKQGLWLLSQNGFRIHAVTSSKTLGDSPKFFLAARVDGPAAFNILACWIKPCEVRPAYVTTILRGLDAYDRFIRSRPTVFLGDFNSHPKFRNGHEKVVERLKQEYGLVSAYHEFHKLEAGDESHATFFMYRHAHRTYHIDYCFMPESWTKAITRVEVGTHGNWSQLSDHCPLSVDLNLQRL